MSGAANFVYVRAKATLNLCEDSMPEETPDFVERYATGQIPWDSGAPSGELVRVLEAGIVTGKKVLELGCGTGTDAVEMARRGFEVVAVDFVEQAIEAARVKARDAKVQMVFRVADIVKDDLGGPYDFVFDRGVYHVVRRENLAAFQELLRRVTRPGSLWLSLAGNAKEEREEGPPVVSEQEIRAELEPLFEIVDLREFRFATNKPDMQPLGWSILMRRKPIV